MGDDNNLNINSDNQNRDSNSSAVAAGVNDNNPTENSQPETNNKGSQDSNPVADSLSEASQPAGTTQENAEPPEDILATFKDRLIEELGLGSAADEDKNTVRDKIDTLVNHRILNLMLLYIPKEKAEELADKAEAGNEAEFHKFLSDNIPSWSDKVFDELFRIRNEILGKLSQNN